MLKTDALKILNEMSERVNIEFKRLYRKTFNKNKYDYAPDIIEFMEDPPTVNDDVYLFWQEFISIYPGSDDPSIISIYKKLSCV